MSLTYSVNNTPATAAVAVFNLKTLLKAAGWTVPSSSDGTTYNASGDQIASGASGANGMDNNRAWFVAAMPGGNRSLCLQRTSATGANSSYQWRVKYSKGAGFSGGSPSATQVPSAADEQIVLGSGTDASPAFASLFGQSTDGGFRHEIVADNASPFGFLSFGFAVTSAIPGHILGMDPVLSACAADPDPYVVHCNGSAGSANSNPCNSQTLALASSTRQLMGFGGSAGTTWHGGATTQTMLGSTFAAGSGYPGAGGVGYWAGLQNNTDGKDDPLPIFVATSAAGYTNSTQYRKGFLSLVRAVGQPGRNTGDRVTISTANDSIVFGQCILPWDGSTVTV